MPKDKESSNLPAIIEDSGVPEFAVGIDKPETILADNFHGRTPRLPQIKTLHAGACCFQMPDGQRVEEFEGVILDTSPARAFWKEAYKGSGNRPDCSSVDGAVPDDRAPEKQSERCADCRHNAWGSDPKGGRGKACKEMARVHFVGKDMMIPHRMTIPPSSLKNLDEYMSVLSSKGLHYNHVKTRTEAVEVNSGSYNFTGIVMRAVGQSVETREQYIKLKKMREDFSEVMRGEIVEAEEYGDDTENPQQFDAEGNPIPF